MAVQDGYGKSSGSESLVFAYDLKDTVNSFRGEPATNSQNADISSMTQVGFDNWSCYDGSPPYHTWGTNQSKTFVTIPGPFGTSVNAMLYHNFNGGFYGPTDWGAVPNGTITAGRTYTVQGWVKAADSSSIGKTVTPYTYYSHSGGAYSAGTNYILTDQWQLVSHTHTAQYNASGDGVMYFFTQNSGEVKMHLTMTGVFLDESHAVQWIVGGSTRSNTQGLLDLTGNNTIDLSNVSFDSNAKMVFDGTNDYIGFGDVSGNIGGKSQATMELILKIDALKSNDLQEVFGFRNNSNFDFYMIILPSENSGLTEFRARNSSGTYYDLNPNINSYIGNYIHIIFSVGPGGRKVYFNGSLVGSSPTWTGSFGATSPFSVGNYLAGMIWSVMGEIPVAKLYDRELSSTEITNNYLKYKRQYGLT